MVVFRLSIVDLWVMLYITELMPLIEHCMESTLIGSNSLKVDKQFPKVPIGRTGISSGKSAELIMLIIDEGPVLNRINCIHFGSVTY